MTHKTMAYVLILFLVSPMMLVSARPETPTPPAITLATVDYPPLMGKSHGIMTDIVKKAFNAEGIDVQYTIFPIARIPWSLRQSDVPAVVGSMDWIPDPDEKKALDHIQIYHTSFHFFYLKDRFPNGLSYTNLEALKAYRIGYIRGGGLTPIFKAAHIEPDWVVTLEQNAKKLYRNRIDMFAATEIAGWDVVRHHFPDVTDRLAMDKKPIQGIYGDIIFSRNHQKLSDSFRKGLDTIKRNGVYMGLFKDYYGENNIPPWVIESNRQASDVHAFKP